MLAARTRSTGRLRVAFAVLGGGHEASPKIGGQVGFEVGFPAVLHRPAASRAAADSLKTNLMQWRSP